MSKTKTTKTTATKTRKAKAPTSDQIMAAMAAASVDPELSAGFGDSQVRPTSAPQTSSAGPEAKGVVAKGRKARVTPTPSGETEKVTSQDGPTVEDLVAIARDAGMECLEQSSFWKLVGKGKARIYVAKSKKGITRIDLVGLDIDHKAIIRLTEEEAKALKVGKVRQRLMPRERPEGWVTAYGLAVAAAV